MAPLEIIIDYSVCNFDSFQSNRSNHSLIAKVNLMAKLITVNKCPKSNYPFLIIYCLEAKKWFCVVFHVCPSF